MLNSRLALRLGSNKPSRSGSNVLALAEGASAWGVRAMNGGNPRVMRVQRSNHGGQGAVKDFHASEVENGSLLSWVTEFSSTGDGFVNALYDQSDRGFHWFKDQDFNAPKIVINGALSLDSENKLAINGNGAKLRLGADNSTVNTNFFSSDGTWSLFLVTDFPNYSGATNANVQIVHLESIANGGANSPRKPVIACNRANNELAVAQPTQTIGSNTTGNIYLPTYPQEQLFSNFGNPALSTNNNEGFLDGVGRGATGHSTTNDATAVNTSTSARSIDNILFQPTETNVTTFLSALIYAPSYLFDKKEAIESSLVDIYNITFV
tara:strand:+ start:3575 stop:4540 length:966 start_codon:yes stop_codon:yes gene_type:complete